jgi:hypothetical protein
MGRIVITREGVTGGFSEDEAAYIYNEVTLDRLNAAMEAAVVSKDYERLHELRRAVGSVIDAYDDRKQILMTIHNGVTQETTTIGGVPVTVNTFHA